MLPKEKYRRALDCTASAINRFKNIYVSWSGGKGSTATLLLALELNPKIKVLFIDNGDEHKEIYDYVKRLSKELDLNISTVHSREDFFQVLRRHPPRKLRFGKTKPRCGYWFKEEPARRFNNSFDADAVILGIQSCEGFLRRSILKLKGPVFFHKTLNIWKVNPIHDWSDEDVKSYVESKVGRMAELYYDGNHNRTGCLHCFQYIGWHKHMKKAHPLELKKLKKEFDRMGFYVKNDEIKKKGVNSIDSYSS